MQRSSTPTIDSQSLLRASSCKLTAAQRRRRTRSDPRLGSMMETDAPTAGSARTAAASARTTPIENPVIERPTVDPTIRSIPQGWHDDPGLPLPAGMRPTSPAFNSSALLRKTIKKRDYPESSFLTSTRAKFRSMLLPVDQSSVKELRTTVRPPPAFSRGLPGPAGVSVRSTWDTQAASMRSSAESDGPSAQPADPRISTPSLLSTGSSASSSAPSKRNRDRVLGIVKGDRVGQITKPFAPPNLSEIIPFADDQPLAAWSSPARPSGSNIVSSSTDWAWRNAAETASGMGKRAWRTTEVSSPAIYRVGYERYVLDCEARLHECLHELLGGRYTLCELETDCPQRVLDLGTGAGHWPIAMARSYPNASIVGLDRAPCQVDLAALISYEERVRHRSGRTDEGEWGAIAGRVKWHQADFLDTLPYDSAVFDLVHLRFAGLGIPEHKWPDVIEEAMRVLKPGGQLEIIETSYHLPISLPPALRHAFASALASDHIHIHPHLAVQFALPTISGLDSRSVDVALERHWSIPPPALRDSLAAWLRSVLDYKGTGMSKLDTLAQDLTAAEAIKALYKADRDKWTVDLASSEIISEWKSSLYVWSVRKKAG